MADTNLAAKEERAEIAHPETTRETCFTPRVDILETDQELTLFADLPGIKPENADVRFEKGELLLHGRCPARHEGTEYLYSEYGIGDFYRSFSISQDIDASKISAELKNGVLTVHLPKTEAVKARHIPVTSGSG